MKSSIKDKVTGALHEAKGRIRELVGKADDNPTAQAKGTVEKTRGQVQQKVGQIKAVVGK
jgi:uncharacterized protein YjbJ (UPF0337 family)